MMEEPKVFIETVTDISIPEKVQGRFSEFLIGYKDGAGRKQQYRMLAHSERELQELKGNLLPGTKVAVLRVDGELECLVIVKELDERGHLKSWTKLKVGPKDYSHSQKAMLRNITPTVH